MRILILFAGLLLSVLTSVHAQETVEVNVKTDNGLYATYHVLKSNTEVKSGQYLLGTRKKNMAVAMGAYSNNRKTGVWRFFDPAGGVLQIYDYDKNELTYEAPENPAGAFKYIFDVDLKSTDTLTKPIRVGGRYYGYLNYAKLFISPAWFKRGAVKDVMVELLISPGGRLAGFDFILAAKVYDEDFVEPQKETLHVNLNAMAEEDKTFIPATLNGQPVSSRILIRAKLAGYSKLEIPTK